MKKKITFLRTIILAAALMILSVNAQSQTPTNGGFENGSTGWTFGTGTRITNSITSTPAELRTGSGAYKASYNAAEVGGKIHISTQTVGVANGNYVHAIGWFATNVAINGGVVIYSRVAGSSTASPGYASIGVTGFVQKTFNSQNNSGASANYECVIRTKSTNGASNIYSDDIILYTDANTTSDITKPVEPTVLIGSTGTASSTTFTWTNGSETPTTGATLPAQTGIQATIILRAENSVSSTPTLNDQAIYSVAGGTAGPNMVNGTDWKVISTSVSAAATSYTDNDAALVSGTTYKYAVIHRDLAYNYSVSLVGTAATESSSEPTSKLVISSITPSNAVIGGSYEVTIVSKTASDLISSVTSDTEITLTQVSGAGALTGTLTGTITNGTNSVTISGVSYDTAETGVSISATATTGMTGLTSATSSTFTVFEAIPSTKASAITLVSKTSSEISLSWTNGDGAGRIAVARLSSSPAVAPTLGTIYTANSSSFVDGLNSTTGAGNIVIYNGTGSAVTVTNLAPSTGYVVDIYEYSSNTNIANYTTTSALGYTPTYAIEPTVQASEVTFTDVASTSMTINCTAGDGANRIIVVKAGSAVDAAPVDGTYITSPNTTFGSGTQLGTGNYVVSRISNSVNVTGLTPNTIYYVSVWEYNGTQAPTNYLLTNPAIANVTTSNNLIVNTNSNISALLNCPTCDLIVNEAELTVNESRTYNSLTIAAGGKVTNDNATATTLTLNNNFTIESSANGTGTYVEKQNGALIVGGTTTVKQHLKTASGGRNWFISTPISDATSNVVKNIGENKLWSYTEANIGTALWNEIIDTNTPLVVMSGYVAKPSADGVIEFTGGALNTGSKTSPILTNNGTVSTGFNLVGNPYPSFIDWDMATLNNVSTSIWYRSKSTGTYVFQTYNVSGVDANGGSRLIPPMQSFWVKATGAGASVTIENAARSHQDQSISTNRLKTKSVSNHQLLRLQISAGDFKDEAVVYFNDNAANELDQYDSEKMWNNIVNIPELYTIVGGKEVVINGMKSVAENLQLNLGFKTGESNNYTLKATEINNFDTDMRIILKDNEKNSETDITDGTSYSFRSEAVNTISRFSLVFRSPSITTQHIVPSLTMNIRKNENNQLIITSNATQNGTINISNMFGQLVKKVSTTGTVSTINNIFDAGAYIITIEIAGAKRTEKIILN